MNEISPQVKSFFDLLCADNPHVLFSRMQGGARVFSLRTWEDGITTETPWNEAGWDFFFTVGVTDGSGSRRRENMLHPRALFVDLDQPETSQASLDFLLDQPNRPTAVVNTSPGKFHVYWAIEPGLAWDKWIQYQKFLASQIIARFGEKAADISVCDPSRILRVPGSLHHKGDPYRGGITHLTDRRYTVGELKRLFPSTLLPTIQKTKAFVGREYVEHMDDYKTKDFNWLMKHVEVIKEVMNGYVITCPNHAEHTTGGDDALLYVPASKNNWWGGFICQHDHCKKRFGTSGAIRQVVKHLKAVEVQESIEYMKRKYNLKSPGAAA